MTVFPLRKRATFGRPGGSRPSAARKSSSSCTPEAAEGRRCPNCARLCGAVPWPHSPVFCQKNSIGNVFMSIPSSRVSTFCSLYSHPLSVFTLESPPPAFSSCRTHSQDSKVTHSCTGRPVHPPSKPTEIHVMISQHVQKLIEMRVI